MFQLAFVSACSATFAVIGHDLDVTIHGTGWAAPIPAVAGALGGFDIGCASLDVVRRWRLTRATA
jgi:hypothetical protein